LNPERRRRVASRNGIVFADGHHFYFRLAGTLAPPKNFYGTDNCLPLSAEFIFNKNGAAVLAHSRGAG